MPRYHERTKAQQVELIVRNLGLSPLKPGGYVIPAELRQTIVDQTYDMIKDLINILPDEQQSGDAIKFTAYNIAHVKVDMVFKNGVVNFAKDI